MMLKNSSDCSPKRAFLIGVKTAKKNIDKAIENLVETIHRYFLRYPKSGTFATEAFKGLKFDVIEDEDLENASDDRVREHFNAHVRSLRLFSADHRLENQTRHWYKDNLNRPQGPKRYTICIILDEETMDSLAAIKFPQTLNKDKEVLKDISIKVVLISLEFGRLKIDELQRLGNHVILVVAYPDIPVLDDTTCRISSCDPDLFCAMCMRHPLAQVTD
ncbi:hypothetical protein HG530_007039 [Fusarium avenaceum]|nr:hypothetical protein HG530_007039 [Fusarium avenaceum]